MQKTLSVRPNKHIMSLLFEIQQHLPETNRTQIINLAIAKAINKNVKWDVVAKKSYNLYSDLKMPEFMQIKVNEDLYQIIYDEILESFKEHNLKRVIAPYFIKLVLINYLHTLLDQDEKESILDPIKQKLKEWINYEINSPKVNYEGNERVHDIYRALNDRDCQLTSGNLMADTIFSLWTPLKMVLENLNPGEKFYKRDKKTSDKNYHLKRILKDIDDLLPVDNHLVQKLCSFADLSLTRANVMFLPHRGMQTRGIVENSNGKRTVIEWFNEQMPRTLYECFDGGEFRDRSKGRCFFKSDRAVIDWIHEEKLEFFFEGKIKKENLKPLIERCHPREVCWLKDEAEIGEMLDNFVRILKLRKRIIEDELEGV